MKKQTTHGGLRSGAGRPAIMEDKQRVTITLERSQINEMRKRYGRQWLDVIRTLIDARLNTTK